MNRDESSCSTIESRRQDAVEDCEKLSALMLYLTNLDDHLHPQPLPITTNDDLAVSTSTIPDRSALIMDPTGACDECSQPILDRFFLMIADRCWHSRCLRCSLCYRPLDQAQSCFFKDGLIFCRDDYLRRFARRCQRCHRLLGSNDVVMRARDCVYHLHCFNCIVCLCPLQPGDTFAMGDGENGALYCQGHYEPLLIQTSTSMDHGGDDHMAMMIRSSSKTKQTRKRNSRGSKTSSSFECNDQLNGEYGGACGDNAASLDDVDAGDDSCSTGSRSKRMRTSFKHHQLRTMKTYFNLNHNPDAKDLKSLAQKTGLTKRVLQVWFQNARAKYRRNVHGTSRGDGLSPILSLRGVITEPGQGRHREEDEDDEERINPRQRSITASLSPGESEEANKSDRGESVADSSEDSACKTLAEYFGTDAAIL